MAINLTKGQGISLNKGISNVHFMIAWDSDVDMDIHALVLKNSKAVEDGDFIFFNNLVHSTGAVKHSGDIRNGQNVLGTDDEVISVDLNKLSQSLPDRDEVVFTAEIYNGAQQGIDFSDIGVATCKVVNADNNEVLVEYRLDVDLVGEVCAKVARLVKDNGAWRFEALGQGQNSLIAILQGVGLNV